MSVDAIQVRQVRNRRQDGSYCIPAPVRALRFWAFIVALSALGYVLTAAAVPYNRGEVTLHVEPKKAQAQVQTPEPIAVPTPTASPGEPEAP